jgi:hypothetical protein
MPTIIRKARAISPGFRWALTCRFKPQDGVTEIFPAAATYEAQIRMSERSNVLMWTLTTANGGIVIPDPLAISFVLSDTETANIKAQAGASKAIEFDVYRTDLPQREYVGVKFRVPFNTTVSR